MFELTNTLQDIVNSSNTPQKTLAKYKNNYSFMNHIMRCLNIALHRYKFNGLPDTIKERPLKRALLHHGNVIFFEENGGLFALPGGGMADVNIYGEPGTAWIYGMNGFNKELKLAIPGGADASLLRKNIDGQTMPESKKGVYVRENYCNYPFVNYCIETAIAIADTMRTLDVVRKNIKHPYLISAEQSIINTIKSFFNKRDNNEEYIISSGVFPADKIKMLPLDQNPEAIKCATDLIEWYWNLFFELCGFNSNSNPDKKAQLTTVEINSNNDIIALQAAQVIECLTEDLELVNKLYGTNITVEKTDLSEYNETIGYDNEEENEDDRNADDSNKDIQ